MFCRSFRNLIFAFLCLFDHAYADVLSGTWTTPWSDTYAGYFHKFSRTFANQMMITRSNVLISMPSRGLYLFELEHHYRYRLGAVLRTEGAKRTYELDIVSDKVLLTPRTESSAGFFWQTQECGIGDWQVDVAIDVSGRTCRQTGDNQPWFVAGSYRSYDIAVIDSEQVQFGDVFAAPNFDGQSPQRRPRAVTANLFVKATP